MSHLRAIWRVAALSLLGAAIIPAQLLVAGPVFKNFDALPALLWKYSRKVLGIKVAFNAAALCKDRPMLYMANHVSVLDPLILASISKKSGFVAMKEIAKWPIFGAFARGIGTIFASNDKSSGALRSIHAQLTATLNSGRHITFCPEGLITDGTKMAPFKTGIISVGFNNLSQEGELRQKIGYQPFALRLTRIEGREVSENPALRRVYMVDKNKNILSQIWQMLGTGSVEAEVTALEDMDPAAFTDARHLADAARDRIAEALNVH